MSATAPENIPTFKRLKKPSASSRPEPTPINKREIPDRTELALDTILADSRAQPREALNTETVKAYAEEMARNAIFPPLMVFYDGEKYWLADGFHRRNAALSADIKVFRCEIRRGGLREAVLFSCSANSTHGQRRSNADKRRAVMRMLEDAEWREWSDSEISRRCKVSDFLVATIRKEHTSISRSMDRTFTHHKTGKPAKLASVPCLVM